MPCPVDCPPDLVNVELEPCSSEYCTCTNGIGYLVVRTHNEQDLRLPTKYKSDKRSNFSHDNFRNAKRALLSTKTSIWVKADAIGLTIIAKTATIPSVQPKYVK